MIIITTEITKWTANTATYDICSNKFSHKTWPLTELLLLVHIVTHKLPRKNCYKSNHQSNRSSFTKLCLQYCAYKHFCPKIQFLWIFINDNVEKHEVTSSAIAGFPGSWIILLFSLSLFNEKYDFIVNGMSNIMCPIDNRGEDYSLYIFLIQISFKSNCKKKNIL